MELMVLSCLEALKKCVEVALGDMVSRQSCQCQVCGLMLYSLRDLF